MSKYPFHRGFTLIETMVAVSIVVTAVVGPLSIIAGGISEGGFARNQVTAFYLAQEGMELLRNLRDSDALNATPPVWPGSLQTCLNQVCTMDAREKSLALCPSGVCPNLLYHKGGGAALESGLYVDRVVGGLDPDPAHYITTNYIREIRLVPAPAPNDTKEVYSTVTVRWLNGTVPKSIELRKSLFKRHP